MSKQTFFFLFRRRCLLSIVISIAAFPRLAAADNIFLNANKAFAFTVEAARGPNRETQLSWSIAPGYYLYKDRFHITDTLSKTVLKVALPQGNSKADPYFGTVQVYRDAVAFPIQVSTESSITVTWQGCADAGLCYPPQSRTILVNDYKKNTDHLDGTSGRQRINKPKPKPKPLPNAMGNQL